MTSLPAEAAETSLSAECRAIASGDADAFGRFYDAWFDYMYQSARRASKRDEAFCLDVVHDAMLRLMRSMRPFEDRDALRAWLRIVVTRCAYDRLRSERRRALREHDASRNRATINGSRSQNDELAERIAWLRRELRQLPAAYRDVLDIRLRSDRTLAEAARLLGDTLGATHGRFRRAMNLLRRRAHERFEQDDEHAS